MSDEPSPTRWSEKHRLIAEAATALFLRKGYLGTSMDDIAAEAAVSKQTV
jgi:TetR/AcrR family transcriptional repressor of mexJK operon